MEKIDQIEKTIQKIISESEAPLETKEVIDTLQHRHKEISRSTVLYRLNNLRAKGEIIGKTVGSGKGTWIWWQNKAERLRSAPQK